MTIMQLDNFAEGRWISPGTDKRPLNSAVTGDVIAEASSSALNFAAMADYARNTGGKALRDLTFHDRAKVLKALAQHLHSNRDALYQLSFETGATKADSMVDIDGGIGTLFVFASKGRRELPASKIYVDGNVEALSRDGTFIGRHVYTPLQGVGVHINAFNFPVWGMLEKFAPTFLAGMPTIVKPATDTAYLTHACFRLMVDSGLLPEGSIQLICGSTGDLLDHMSCQDVVSFTGSATTAQIIGKNEQLRANNTRFVAETDSLNASILGPDAISGTPEFDLFVKEVVREMTAKAGQKCTAIRRAIVPESQVQAVSDAIVERLSSTTIGNPANKETRMGALAGQRQRSDVMANLALLENECERVFGDQESLEVSGADRDKGAFVSQFLLRCNEPDSSVNVHEIEAFGPVSTIMPYRDVDHAVELANKGGGSLVVSAFTHDNDVALAIVAGSASHHGRLLFADRTSGKESTGHGAPMPHMVHGGPGRAGGGEELGGIRAVLHYMQRSAIQGSPETLAAITGVWTKGASVDHKSPHPFRLTFNELEIGKTIHTGSRTITLADIEQFAEFTGDNFYAHMDEEAAKANPFFPGRVAHGYLILSFAAGLFVDAAPGPVLANTGLDNLRFLKPVSPGDTIKVQLTAMNKKKRNDDHGEVRWQVEVTNQDDEPVAQYELLTMNSI